ncbi:hypothetical protein ES703_100441 [subsurface metagenome]
MYSFPISRQGKGYCIVLIGFSHSPGRKDDYLIGVSRHGDANFGTSDYNPVISDINHMNIGVRVSLLRRSLDSITFHISLGTSGRQVFFLVHLEVIYETVMITGAVFVINLFGGDGKGYDSVHTHTPLYAAADSMAE